MNFLAFQKQIEKKFGRESFKDASKKKMMILL